MAKRGAKPKPTALHKLHGTYNPAKHGRDRAGEPDAPPATSPPRRIS